MTLNISFLYNTLTKMEDEKEDKKKDEEPYFRSLRFNFNQWNLGGKLIFVAALLAIISQVLPWIKGRTDTLGYQQGASIFLALYLYPFFALSMDKTMNKIAGYLFGCLIIILPAYFLYYMSGEMAAPILEITGAGIILFMFSGFLLIAGIYDYRRYLREEDRLVGAEKEEKKKGKPCPDCDKPMEYVEDWDRWYCENCDEYK